MPSSFSPLTWTCSTCSRWPLAYGKYAMRDLVEVVLFVGILSLAIVYAWCKGVFEWKRKDWSRTTR